MNQPFTKQVIAYLTNRRQELEETIRYIDNTIALLSASPIKQLSVPLSDNEVQQASSYKQKTNAKLKQENTFSPKSKLDRKIAYILTK
ncbi:hypothetical protein H8S90_01310 [Olivibacter sp. SDN3]|uniref:hypothetical protein n=1 Tax=Olivibacter sp. SDN3 TaxID=2764720 RepID=UPI0016511B98|nr:hypothetical protein [Olivibacter sp. SDN3]QNL50297.1 hypothetical protein H8S90_01310 [Olivibacter sp. SDN3]